MYVKVCYRDRELFFFIRKCLYLEFNKGKDIDFIRYIKFNGIWKKKNFELIGL